MAVTLVNRLELALGVRISAVKLIQGPSIARLVEEILPDLNAGKEQDATAATAADCGDAGSRPAGRWLVTVGPRAAPRLRLFCFPFAGGGSAVFHSWAQSLDPSIEVVAVEAPGRLGAHR